MPFIYFYSIIIGYFLTFTLLPSSSSLLIQAVIAQAKASPFLDAERMKKIEEMAPKMNEAQLKNLQKAILTLDQNSLNFMKKELEFWQDVAREYKVYKNQKRKDDETEDRAKEEKTIDDLLKNI